MDALLQNAGANTRRIRPKVRKTPRIQRRSQLTSVRISAFTLGAYANHEGLADRFDVLKDGRAKKIGELLLVDFFVSSTGCELPLTPAFPSHTVSTSAVHVSPSARRFRDRRQESRVSSGAASQRLRATEWETLGRALHRFGIVFDLPARTNALARGAKSPPPGDERGARISC